MIKILLHTIEKQENENGSESLFFAFRSLLFPVFFLLLTSVSFSMDVVTVKTDGAERTIEGEIIVNAKDGGIVIRDALNEFYPVTPDNIIRKTSDERPFTFYTASEIKEKLQEKLPLGFKVYETKHYLLFYDTSEAFAKWTAQLYERLYDVFYNFWGSNGMTLTEPSTPLIAIIFANSKEYEQFCKSELGEAGSAIIGFYSMQTNRVNLFDLTGIDQYNHNVSARVSDMAKIRNLLAQPDSARLVATIVHEATHQLAYNSGLMIRYADMPRWVSEGVAMYFETPNLKSSSGWASLGKDNPARLRLIKKRLERRNPEAIKMMITDDSLFTNLEIAEEAYAEAWGLTWLLIKRNPKKFVQYMKIMSQKTPFVWDSAEERLDEFEKCFGSWVDINRSFINVMKSKRIR